MTTTIETPTPLHGAAYQVLYEQFNPVACVTRAQQASLRTQLGRVLDWAGTLPRETELAYRWAADLVERQVEGRLRQTELARACGAALETIARPTGVGE